MATLAENLLQLNATKQAIKTAIESKGQDLTGVPFPKYAEKIEEITSDVVIQPLTVKENGIYNGWTTTDGKQVAFSPVTVNTANVVGKRFTTGTVVFTKDNGRQIITHNLGAIPSFFLMLVKDKNLNFTIGAEDAPKAGLYGFIFVKDAVLALNFTGESIKLLGQKYGMSLEWRNSGTTVLHWTSDTGNITTDELPTATEITTGYRSAMYKYLAGVPYEWIAIE